MNKGKDGLKDSYIRIDPRHGGRNFGLWKKKLSAWKELLLGKPWSWNPAAGAVKNELLKKTSRRGPLFNPAKTSSCDTIWRKTAPEATLPLASLAQKRLL